MPSRARSVSPCATRTWRAIRSWRSWTSRPSRGQRRADGRHDRQGLPHRRSGAPGRRRFNGQGRLRRLGPIQVLHFSYFQDDFPDTFRTAVEIRNEIAERGGARSLPSRPATPCTWPTKSCATWPWTASGCDGLVIHMLLGKLKPGDIPAPVRDAAIRKMVELYFPPNSAMVTGYGFDMLYAGPREAVLHAYFRQNMGATHFIVGRDHAGVGDYYGAFDAQIDLRRGSARGCSGYRDLQGRPHRLVEEAGQGGDDARGAGSYQRRLRASVRNQGSSDALRGYRTASGVFAS